MTQPFNITVGFSTTNKWVSKVIRWATRSPCSHAWIAFNDETLGIRAVLQAETWGYELRPWKRWRRENILVAEFLPTGPTLEESLQWIATFLGSRYDYKAAFLSGLWRWWGRLLRGRLNDPTKLMCSEGVVRFLQRGQYWSMSEFDPEVTNPKRLLVRCLQSPKEFSLKYAKPGVAEKYGVR